jgi:hypothetical protein
VDETRKHGYALYVTALVEEVPGNDEQETGTGNNNEGKLDLFSLNDAFLFWQYYLRNQNHHAEGHPGSPMMVVFDVTSLGERSASAYFAISWYFSLAALYYGHELYNGFFILRSFGEKRQVQRLAEPFKNDLTRSAPQIRTTVPLIPVDASVFKQLDQPLWEFLEENAPINLPRTNEPFLLPELPMDQKAIRDEPEMDETLSSLRNCEFVFRKVRPDYCNIRCCD